MILKSQLKQMFCVAIARNGSNLLYGKVTCFFYLLLLMFLASYNDYEPYILDLKELQIPSQLNFCSDIYTLR